MKRKNKKLITFILAGMMCAATVGAATTAFGVSAATAAQTYKLSDVFSASSNVLGAETVGEMTTKTTAFTLADGNFVRYKRDLALKWHTADGAKYLNIGFAFGSFNFKSISFTFETAPAQSTKDDKSVNTVKFVNSGGAVFAEVWNGKAEEASSHVGLSNPELIAGTTLKLAEGDNFGEFKVFIGETEIGTFTNIGVNFADYKADSTNSFEIKAEQDGEEKTTIFLNEINGQSFNNLTGEGANAVVTDNAAPILVVNEDVRGFVLGTKFNLSYVAIDVLQGSGLSETKQYYQYNPSVTEFNETNDYKTLTISSSSGTVFMDTVYTTAEEKTTSVFEEFGKEFVSIKITLGDKAHAEDAEKATYELAWYADAAAVETKTVGTGEKSAEKSFIIFDRNTEAPAYKYITANETDLKNDVDSAMDTLVAEYQAKLDKLAEDVHAGSNSRIDFPSLDWLLGDNNGYNNLKFTIAYYAPSSTSVKSVSRDFDELYLKDLEEGLYEFKVYATDKAGNTMKYYLEEELVNLSTSNVWDIDAIPSFTFNIENQGIYVEEDDDILETEIIGETYTMTEPTVVGVSNKKADYALYEINYSAYKGSGKLNIDALSKITYSSLLEAVKAKIPTITDGTYIDLYLTEYCNLVANKIGGEAAAVKACFTKIEEYDDRKEADEGDNKYNWDATAKSFSAVEETVFIILADYSDADLSYVDRAVAYKIIEIDAEADSIKGETEWLKNNIVSVILFAIAALMLVLIIILLLIKPSDETLEDVDLKAINNKSAKKNEKK